MVRSKGHPHLEGLCLLIVVPAGLKTLQHPHAQVPMMTYSGPKDAPTNPSPESFKLTESFILLEFIADLSLSANLYANDPVQRAQIRVFIDTFSKKFLDQWYCTHSLGKR